MGNAKWACLFYTQVLSPRILSVNELAPAIGPSAVTAESEVTDTLESVARLR